MAESLTEEWTSTDFPDWKPSVRQIPYPPYRKDILVIFLGIILAISFVVLAAFQAAMVSKNITIEKKMRLKASTK